LDVQRVIAKAKNQSTTETHTSLIDENFHGDGGVKACMLSFQIDKTAA
jgi:hypothetical protein